MTLSKNWRLIFDETAERQFAKLDKPVRKRIFQFIDDILVLPNPKAKALQMTGHRCAFFRYRVGDYRLICRFEDSDLVIICVKVGHRRHVYKGNI
jgi:mRNA interferase RelE/StbE